MRIRAVTLGRDWNVRSIPYARTPKRLPDVLTQDEVLRLFAGISNHKHRAMAMTLYGAALRVSEVAQLRTIDIDAAHMLIHVRQGKGTRDRVVPLADALLKELRRYYRLVSALAFHELTTQVPRAVDIAIARGAEKPRIDYPPVNAYWFSAKAFTEGVETLGVGGKTIQIYGAEKSIADVFKYRSKVGMDIALKALRNWRGQRRSWSFRHPDYECTLARR